MNYNFARLVGPEKGLMAANAWMQGRINAAVNERAAAVLDNMGLTISDAVRILLTRVANEGALPARVRLRPRRLRRLVPGEGARGVG